MAQTSPEHCQANRLCVECGGPLKTKRQRSWCSPKCVHEYRIRSDANYARRAVKARDHGVCSQCGTDTDQVRRAVDLAHERAVAFWWRKKGLAEVNARLAARGMVPGEARRPPTIFIVNHNKRGGWGDIHRSALPYVRAARKHVLSRLGWESFWQRKSFWDVDHVVAVKDGGGRCGLDGLQTLCVGCHAAKTAGQNRKHA